MKKVILHVDNYELDFDSTKKMTEALALPGNPETTLVAWYDKNKDVHSPSGVQCENEEFAGWEEYGRHHGGRLKFSVNNGEYILIYT